MRRIVSSLLFLLMVLCAVTACSHGGTAAPTAIGSLQSSVPPTPTPAPPTNTETPVPSATATEPPTDTPQASSTLTPTVVTPTETPRSSSIPQPGYVPLFEPADCQFPGPFAYEVECGYLTVPEDRSQPRSPKIRLHVAIFKSRSANPEPDPVVHLVGGPGGSLLDTAREYINRGGHEILKVRDYVMFNQRGTHYAEPFLSCPGRTELQREWAEQGLTLEEQNKLETAFLLECHEDLLDQGIDLAAYNSAENAADVEDLRVALDYGQINLYGISYASRLALTVMRDHPESVYSAVIDAVLPPQAGFHSKRATSADNAFKGVEPRLCVFN
jgi:pimeloyl-ACP methyl ester carboxylesterase